MLISKFSRWRTVILANQNIHVWFGAGQLYLLQGLTILAGNFFYSSDESFHVDESNDELINLSYKSQNFVLLFYLNIRIFVFGFGAGQLYLLQGLTILAGKLLLFVLDESFHVTNQMMN